MNLCKDCKWLAGRLCMRNSPPMVTDYINGGTMPHPLSGLMQSIDAQQDRMGLGSSVCGPKGKFFEQK